MIVFHTVTDGKTLRNVLMTIRRSSGTMLYPWIHWSIMPPGRSRSRAILKSSTENNAARPPIHGFEGSEMIRS